MSLPITTIHTDGASRGNPGAAAYGYVIATEDGERIEGGDCLGVMTNNRAEYEALVRALEHAVQLDRRVRLEIRSDSELMVKQVNGDYRVKNEELQTLHARIMELLDQFDEFEVRHVPRAENKRADELCNEALDGKRSSPTTQSNPTGELRVKAIECLRAAADAWSKGQLSTPTPETVWQQLCELLLEHRVIDRAV